MKTLRVLIPTLLFLAAPSLLLAQHPLSGDLRVNVETGESQQFPHLAANPMGEFVVTWTKAHSDDAGSSLFAVRFNANGTPATGEILIAEMAAVSASNSAVAMMDDGSFVVVYPNLVANDLAARRYNPDGTPAGAELAVSRNWTQDFSVSTRGDGGFVVAWQGGQQSLWARVFPPSHAAGPELRIAPAGTDPAVAVGPQGAFVVAWQNGNLVARRFTPQGAPVSPVFTVASGAGQPRIAKDDSGDFLIFWGGPAGSVLERRYAADTTPIGGLLHLQAGKDYDVAVGGKGNFVLAWEASDTVHGGTNVFARRFKSDGSPLGPQLRVNLHARGSQQLPSVGIGADGGFVVVWQSQADGTTTSDIFARRYDSK
jgi:hypothetical protein